MSITARQARDFLNAIPEDDLDLELYYAFGSQRLHVAGIHVGKAKEMRFGMKPVVLTASPDEEGFQILEIK